MTKICVFLDTLCMPLKLNHATIFKHGSCRWVSAVVLKGYKGFLKWVYSRAITYLLCLAPVKLAAFLFFFCLLKLEHLNQHYGGTKMDAKFESNNSTKANQDWPHRGQGSINMVLTNGIFVAKTGVHHHTTPLKEANIMCGLTYTHPLATCSSYLQCQTNYP